MKKSYLFILFFLIILTSCTPRISKSIQRHGVRMGRFDPVVVLSIDDSLPSTAIELGTIKVRDRRWQIDKCNFNKVLIDAKAEARHVGGNMIKVFKDDIDIEPLDTCHKISAKIFLVKDSIFIKTHVKVDSSLFGKGYSLVHFYRPSAYGLLVSYNIHDGDDVLTRSKYDWKTSVRISKYGRRDFWGRTEMKGKCSIDIKPERHYYVKCGIRTGLVVGVPKLEVMETELGKYEYDQVEDIYFEKSDYVYLKDGNIKHGKILKENKSIVLIKSYGGLFMKKIKIEKSKIDRIETEKE